MSSTGRPVIRLPHATKSITMLNKSIAELNRNLTNFTQNITNKNGRRTSKQSNINDDIDDITNDLSNDLSVMDEDIEETPVSKKTKKTTAKQSTTTTSSSSSSNEIIPNPNVQNAILSNDFGKYLEKLKESTESYHIYTRTSTMGQTEERFGREYQVSLCENFLKTKFNVNARNVYHLHEIGSSYNQKNKLIDLKEKVEDVEEYSLIVVSEISRLGRDAFQVFDVLKSAYDNKCRIISVMEKLIFNLDRKMNTLFYEKVIDSIKESDRLSNRVMAAQDMIRANGGHIGRAPYGMKLVKKKLPNGKLINIIEPNKIEQQVKTKIRALYNQTHSLVDTRREIYRHIATNRLKPLSAFMINSIALGLR